LISLLVDKRFDRIRLAHPEQFDVAALWSKQLEAARAAVKESPRSVPAVRELLRVLWHGNRYDEMLALASDALKRGPEAFADSKEFAWVAEDRADALEGLDRWDAALEQRRDTEKGSQDVGILLNLADLYVELDRPKEALALLEGIGEASDYGRMAEQSVRHRAALEMGDREAAERALNWMRDHRKDAPTILLRELCRQGELEEASTEARAQLQSPTLRSGLLERLQEYTGGTSTPRMREWSARWKAVFARPEVKAAIDEVGRVETWTLGR
jgi:tetratricopeptide (TPR) repeat protein